MTVDEGFCRVAADKIRAVLLRLEGELTDRRVTRIAVGDNLAVTVEIEPRSYAKYSTAYLNTQP